MFAPFSSIHSNGIVARPLIYPWSYKEKDSLKGFETSELVVKDLDGNEIGRFISVIGRWTHTELECIDYYRLSHWGWDAYLVRADLTAEWVGGSEV
ncbi:hypothetical protein [Pectobacterium versatile]|uniref:hypothetical protein n=1 Tax=Pectobacterium versatile TaxID=2488639 RepID=UPI001F37FC8D|nr:hypothetical protein [Pectobacterium versatile]